MAIDTGEKLKLWVRSGGRCAMCRAYLLESAYTAKEILLGEMAHNAGASTGARSPRGQSDVPEGERDLVDNLLLLCAGCHTEVDKLAQADMFPEEKLRAAKEAHERFVRHVTGLQPDLRTVVVRVIGRVRGTPLDVRAEAAASAVLASTDRHPHYELAPDRQGVEIDLRQLAGETEAGPGYYAAAARQVDEALATRLRPGVEQGMVDHLSVFAYARVPVLVYLGSRLDDTLTVQVYDRHRPSGSWAWPPDGQHVDFRHRQRSAGDPAASDGVLVVNASGTVDPRAVPGPIAHLPTWVVEPDRATPAVGCVSAMSTVDSFERALRALLGDLESTAKHVKRLHVLAAVPTSVAVTLGRAVGWGIHPNLAVYDLVDGAYNLALEVKPQ